MPIITPSVAWFLHSARSVPNSGRLFRRDRQARKAVCALFHMSRAQPRLRWAEINSSCRHCRITADCVHHPDIVCLPREGRDLAGRADRQLRRRRDPARCGPPARRWDRVCTHRRRDDRSAGDAARRARGQCEQGGTTRAGPWPMPPRGARPSRLRSGQLSDANGMAIIVDLA